MKMNCRHFAFSAPYKTAFFTLFTFCFVSFWIGFAFIYTYSTEEKVTAYEKHQGLVIFTGGSKRLQKTFDLIHAGFKGPVLISGVNPVVSRTSLLTSLAPDQAKQVTVDYASQTTRENVSKTIKWAHKKHINTLVLITSSYHMPRSLMLLQQQGWTKPIIPLTVRPNHLPFTFALREYLKFLLSYLKVI